jgi:hypothetical protein
MRDTGYAFGDFRIRGAGGLNVAAGGEEQPRGR